MRGTADDPLRTDHLFDDLRGRTVRGGVAVLGSQTITFAIGLGSTAILARLLSPADFGLIAMAAAFTGLLPILLDLGLSAATVQRADLTRQQIDTLFWINAGLGALAAAAMAALSPLVARFYGQPQLVVLMPVMAISFALMGLTVQHGALMRRQMRFGALARIEIGALVAGIAAGIGSALAGFGYWALLHQQLVQQGTATIATWISSGWRPSMQMAPSAVRPMLSYGVGFTGFNILAYFAKTLDNVIVGRTAGPAALGAYAKAYSLLLLPVDRIRAPASAVVMPALSRLQSDPVRFNNYFVKAITAVAALGMPIVAFLFVFASEVILFVLGPQWRETILLFQVLAPAAFVETFNTVGNWACTPLGRAGRLFRWQLFATPVMIASFLIGARWGALGVAAGYTVATVALRVPAILYLLKDTPVSPRDVLAALAHPTLAAIGAGAAAAALRAALDGSMPGIVLAAIGAAIFGVAYVLLWLVIPGGRRRLEGLAVIYRDLLPRRLAPITRSDESRSAGPEG